MKVVLASGSPRRRDILERECIDFTVKTASVDEELSEKARRDPYAAAQLLAQRKAAAVARPLRDGMRAALQAGQPFEETAVIGADTMVVLDDCIFGKPADEAEAREMLQRLSGKKHQVITGVSVWLIFINRRGKVDVEEITFQETSHVQFKGLSEEDISSYLACGESLDKAGAYAVQGEGAKLIDYYEGDYDNIVGLPVQRLLKLCPELQY